MSVEKNSFGRIAEHGDEVFAYTLRNANGMQAKILTFGGALAQLLVPDRSGHMADVVGGYDTLDSYVNADGYQGALVGRVANRIAKGRFSLGGLDYTLAVNNGVNHLHGGRVGFSHRIWDVVSENDGEEPELKLCLVSPDGEEGYPGTLTVTVSYRLTRQNGLVIRYRATTDKTTIVNLTNHSYFHLGGFDNGCVHSQHLMLDADAYLPTDDMLIPTGEIRSVEGTPFDFRVPKAVGRDIDLADPDLLVAGGYDHCLVFADRATTGPIKRGELHDPVSGRVMELYTDQPCVQFYSGNFLGNEAYPFKGGCPQRKQMLLCLETGSMVDSIHHSHFTNTVLHPGEIYDSVTEYRFGIKH